MDIITSTMYDILTVSGSIFMGLVVGYVFVGTFVYKAVGNINNNETGSGSDDDSSEDDENIDLVKFQYSLYDELSALDSSKKFSKEELDAFKDKFIDIETPEGLCKMSYDNEIESFCYYCDNKSIHYKTLDAVARNYAIKFDCKQICVNYKEEYEKAKAKMESGVVSDNNNTTIVNKKAEEERSPFAKLKSYKTVNNDSKHKNTSNENNKKVLVIARANKFKYKGLLCDMKKPSNENEEKIKNIDYRNFKKFLEQQNSNVTTTM